jgi:hypothetical protein
MIACWYYKVEFRYQLYFQLILGFFLLLTFFLSQFASQKIISVAAEQNNLRNSKENILQTIAQFEILFTKDPSRWDFEKKKIDTLKENVRYLSLTNNQTATNLDSEIASQIQKVYSLATNENEKEKRADIIHILNKCEELLKLRKNTYSN